MADQFAQPTFLAGIKNNVATVDTYAKTVSSNVNNATSAFKDLQSSVQNVLSGSKLVQDITLFKDISDGVKSIDTRAVTDRLSSLEPAIGKATDAFNTLKGYGSQIQSTVAAASNIYNKATAEINGIKAIFDRKNFESISSATNAIKQLSGNNFPLVLKDAATMVGVKSLMVQQAVSLKIPGAITAMTNGVTDAVELGGIIKGVSKEVVQSCDIYALGEIANSATCSHILIGQAPDILGDFAKGYTLPEGFASSELPQLGNDITTTYSKLDPEWNTCTRNGVETADMTIMADASVDFKTAVRASDSATDAAFMVGTGTAEQVAEATSSTSSKPRSSSGGSIIDTLPMGSLKEVSEQPKDNMFNKWQCIGTRDGYNIYMNLYGFGAVEYVKLKLNW